MVDLHRSSSISSSSSSSSSPHVAPLPGDDVEHGGHQEEGAQPHAVHPGGDLLPAVVRQPVQQRHAHDGRRDEELQTWRASVSISIMAALLKGRKHFINSSNILLNNSFCIYILESRNIVQKKMSLILQLKSIQFETFKIKAR